MIKDNTNIKLKIKLLPELPGIYTFKDSSYNIVYVGKAKNLKKRVKSYFSSVLPNKKTQQLVENIWDIDFIVVNSEQEAFLLENNLIKKHQPKYNILLKDGKSYPYICITNEPYPRVIKTRNPQKGLGEYFGPYYSNHTLELIIDTIHQLYPIRTCKLNINPSKKHRVCLKYHLKYCSGICEHKITDEVYNNYIQEAKKILVGDANVISKKLELQIRSLSEQMLFEQAEILQRKYTLLENFKSKTIITNINSEDIDVFGYEEYHDNVYICLLQIHNGSIVKAQKIEYHKKMDESKEKMLSYGIYDLRKKLNSHTKKIIVPFIPESNEENIQIHVAIRGEKKKLLDLAYQNVVQDKLNKIKQETKKELTQREVLHQLKDLLQLENVPDFIDAFDNSNINGAYAVAGCVVFKNGLPSKRDYKHFQIKTVEGMDDYSSMKEVVQRRYNNLLQNKEQLPNLIVADGGIGHMNAISQIVQQEMNLNIPIVGLKKNKKHKTNKLIFGDPPMEIDIKTNSELFHLLERIQDEVHRFAITYHKNLRSKGLTHSQLDDIQNIGPKTKLKLLNQFKTYNNIKNASIEQLQETIGKNRASIVYKYFRQK